VQRRNGALPVIVIMEDSLFRQGVSMLLESDGDITVIAQAIDPADAAETLGSVPSCVVVLDANMCTGTAGVADTMACRAAAPGCRVVIISECGDPACVCGLLDAGAHGYVLKDSPARVLTDAVRSADKGEYMIDSRLIGPLVTTVRDLRSRLKGPGDHTDKEPVLTARQAELMRRVADGLTNHQIASELGISESTVKNHLHQAYARLSVTSRSQAIAACTRLGVLRP
jgi:DNA-binding NarL/FixJ family response regulator